MNKSLPIILKFVVPKQVKELLTFTKEMLAQINSNNQLSVAEQQKVKAIVVELVTNSIKHDLGENAHFKVVIYQSKLIIEKLQKGCELKFNADQQFPFNDLQKKIDIYFSERNKHSILTLGSHEFQFLNLFHDHVAVEEMPEHFGFYIITVAADLFCYHHNPDNRENRYTVEISLSGIYHPSIADSE